MNNEFTRYEFFLVRFNLHKYGKNLTNAARLIYIMMLNSFTNLDWEINVDINLVSEVSVVGEPLEGNNEDLWQHPQVVLLGGLLMLLAPGTVPSVISTQLFLTSVKVQAFFEVDDLFFRWIC